jgi:hypothetical protein
MWPFSKSNDDDDDDVRIPDSPPPPGFYNVSQTPIPIKQIATDDDYSYWETRDGNLLRTKPVDNEGDD